MARLGKTIDDLGRFRQRFEALLGAARAYSGKQPSSGRSDRLRAITGFGSNPGNLRMFAYAPKHIARPPALIVALHGCTQTAASFDTGTGWSTLADKLGFVVVYPEQVRSNNPHSCFSWYVPGDTERDRGEALSIRQMVERAVQDFGVDRQRVFVTGLSAGGAMASVMLATYPDVFAGGAIIAGLPYGSAATVEEAFAAMAGQRTRSPGALGDRVRQASPHQGPWPKVSVWHGSADPTVTPSNGEDIARQWVHLHGLSPEPNHEDVVAGHPRRVWKDAAGETIIEVYAISGMAHGVPLATGTNSESCGAAGPFFLDSGISSTHHIAKFWGLIENEASAALNAADENTAMEDRMAARFAEHDAVPGIGGSVLEPVRASVRWNEAPAASQRIDPNAVIAAAFKAAGLPAPEIADSDLVSKYRVAPDPIIAAAMKAAGMSKA